MVEIERLTYAYPGAPSPALRSVSVAIGSGLTLLAGPSGGGKSTLLRVLDGLVPHFHGGTWSGRAAVCGLDVATTPSARLARECGLVFQDPERQAVQQEAGREVAFPLENTGVPAAEIPGRVAAALERVGAGALSGRRLATLSGGERQRVEIAAALALRPRVLALDEPTSQLDGEGAEEVARACAELARSGIAVVVAEHRTGRFAGCDRALGLDGGRVAALDRAPADTIPTPQPGAEPGEVAWRLRAVGAGPGGARVLEGLELEGRRGEVVVLEGPNGGGKSTLLRVLAGLLAPRSGSVERPAGRAALLPQAPAAMLHRATAAAEVAWSHRLAGVRGDPIRALAELGLQAAAGRYPRDLSGGEGERLATVAVLATGAPILLLDEPTRGMDGAALEALVGALARRRDAGVAIVVATHDERLAAALGATRVCVAGGRAEVLA